MIKLEIGKNVYQIPQNWDEITIGKFQKVVKLDSSVSKKKYLLNVLCTLGDIPESEFKLIPYTEFNKLEEAVSFISTDLPEKLHNEWTFDETTYKYRCNFGKMSTAEYIDLDEMSKDVDNLHMLMGIAYRESEEYDSSKVEDRAELFKNHMPVSVAISSKIFFSLNEIFYSRNTVDYSDNKTEKN